MLNQTIIHTSSKYHERVEPKIIRRILNEFTPHWKMLSVILLVVVASSMSGTLPAYLTQCIINNGIIHRNLREIIHLTLLLVLVAILTGFLNLLRTWLVNISSQNIMASFRLRLFNVIQSQNVDFFFYSKPGELSSRVINDVNAIQGTIVTTVVGFANNIFVMSTTLIFMLLLNWKITIIAMIVVPAFVLPTQRVGRTAERLQNEIQQYISKMNAQLTEIFGINGATLVRSFVRESFEEQKFIRSNTGLMQLQVRLGLVGRTFFIWVSLFSSIGPAVLWGYGGWLVVRHELTLGEVVAFTSLLGRLYNPLSQLVQFHVNAVSSIALFRRIYSTIDSAPIIEDGKLDFKGRICTGGIQVRNLSYSYNGNVTNSLNNVSFKVEPGQMVAVVGPSGAGKTTLLHLIPRFLIPTSGQILIDGIDAKEISVKSLRNNIGIVSQDSFFFNDTIYNNLLYSKPDATMDEIQDVCVACQIHETIMSLPNGYHTHIGERGFRLSGGERQRLSLARVLLKDPSIVLMDEATSALDTIVESKMQEALAILLKERTSIVVAHRLSTIIFADVIIVIENGTVVGMGPHTLLLETNHLYRQLYENQFANGEVVS
ncbi:ABC transporter ATP-binding protein [Alicyclobacillus fastidiosus]|uniref:ABC transporter ATP-binding protein n=1 Tax=Alicyclobacillus fastidiosus TaxID=392011 RepID=UPI0023E9322C|nr:ABC transporter ATP-binding protein [Alicyclobacillus fastidiosus]GMA66060.1 multidrug ABC transporter ATPase [Alicyclobacillus fastidiosus]